jgi:hypothetical protein
MTPPAVSIPKDRGATSRRCNVEEVQVLRFLRSITRENGSLNSSTVGDSFIRVDTLVAFPGFEIIGH